MCMRLYDETEEEKKLRQRIQKLHGQLGSAKYQGEERLAKERELAALKRERNRTSCFTGVSASANTT